MIHLNLVWFYIAVKTLLLQISNKKTKLLSQPLQTQTYIEFYDPEHGDEQEVKGDKEAESPPHIRDAFLLSVVVRLQSHRNGRGVDRPHACSDRDLWVATAAAASTSAFHRWPPHLGRAGPTYWSILGKSQRWKIIGAGSEAGVGDVESLCGG